MTMRRRRTRARTERELGFDVAMGDADPAEARRQPRAEGRRCAHCGAPGRVDIVDTARVRAYLTCRACGHEWEADRFDVMPLPLPH